MCIHSILICLFYVSKSNDRFLIFSQWMSCIAEFEVIVFRAASTSYRLISFVHFKFLVVITFTFIFLFIFEFYFFNGKHKKKMIYIRIYLNLWFKKKKLNLPIYFLNNLNFLLEIEWIQQRKKKRTVELERKKEWNYRLLWWKEKWKSNSVWTL